MSIDLALSGVTSKIDPIWERRSFVSSIKIEQTEIEKARCLYVLLTNLKPDTLEKLQIPIGRWMKSHTYQSPVDKMIDLGIAFESLYVSGNTKISYQLRHNASRYLGKDKAAQEALKREFRLIYKCRCDAVHEGKLDEEVEIEGNTISMSEFIDEAQDLCRQSIIKILEDGEFPSDWNNLILG